MKALKEEVLFVVVDFKFQENFDTMNPIKGEVFGLANLCIEVIADDPVSWQ